MTHTTNQNGPEAAQGEIFARAERDGRAFLSFRVLGIPSRCSGTRLNSMMTESGYLARPSKGHGDQAPSYSISEWKIERRELSEGEWVFMGPDFRGRSLQALLSSVRSERDASAFLSALSRVSKALVSIEEARGEVPAFFAASVVLGDAGDILFLPGSLARGCVYQSRAPLTGFARIDSDARKSPSAFLAAALREAVVLCDGGRRDPRAEALPLSRIAPRLHPALLMADSLWMKGRDSMDLRAWAKALSEAGETFFSPSGPQAESEKARKETALRRIGRVERFTSFLRRRRVHLIVAAALLGVIAIVASTLASARKEAMRFSAYSPERVVETFYAAFASLNDSDMEACVRKGALKGEIRAVLNQSILMKIRFASEQRDPFVRAQAWLDSGKPPIALNDFLFGPTGLSVEPLPGDAPAFRVSYVLWFSSPKGEGTVQPDLAANMMDYTSRAVVDVLRLEMTGLGWKIASLERQEGEPSAETVDFRQ